MDAKTLVRYRGWTIEVTGEPIDRWSLLHALLYSPGRDAGGAAEPDHRVPEHGMLTDRPELCHQYLVAMAARLIDEAEVPHRQRPVRRAAAH